MRVWAHQMRATKSCRLGFAVAGTIASSVTAFVSPLSRASGYRATSSLSRPEVKTSLAVALEPQENELPLPPRDETWNPLGAMRELLAAPDVVEDAARFDRVGRLTGGT